MTRSRTSCVATSAFFSSRKDTTTCDTPSDEVEVSVSMPLMVLTASSILSVTSLSTCSGAAPGSRVVTRTVGMSTLGNWSMPSCVKANSPTTVSDRIEHRREDRPADAERGKPLHDDLPLSATRAPSTSCATLLVATVSPALRPLVISIESPTVWPVVTMRSSARVAVDHEDAGGARHVA